MTPADIDRVFGRGRLRMVTGDHVEVFREASLPGQRRCYTKRFLATPEGDFREWTEREWRILARLVGHGIKPVPDVVQFDRGAADRPALVQTYDAGITVDHWATLLPLERDGVLLRNVFEECAHWWALARASLVALDAIHELRLVHLDLKADNVCIPVGPVDFDPLAGARALHPRFDDITLIDFAFSLVSGERLQSALPIAAQLDYDYQSPRLLHALDAGRQGDLAPTRQLDWRCDMFSLAAMLWRYLPELDGAADRAWTRPRHANARAFVRRLIEVHDGALPLTRPHADLIALAAEPLDQPDLRRSLDRGWTLAIDADAAARAAPTPVTRIALPLAAASMVTPPLAASVATTPQAPAGSVGTTPLAAPAIATPAFAHAAIHVEKSDIDRVTMARFAREKQRARRLRWAAGLATSALAGAAVLGPAWLASHDVPWAGASRPPADVAVARAAGATPPAAPAARALPAASAVQTASSSSQPRLATATGDSAATAVPGQPAASSATSRVVMATTEPTAPAAAPSPSPSSASVAPAPSPVSGSRLAVTRARPSSAAPVPRTTVAVSARPEAPRNGAAARETGATPVARLPPRVSLAAAAAPAHAIAFPSRETNLALARARAARAQLAQTQAMAARAPAGTVAPAPARAQPQPSTPAGDNAYPWAVAGKVPSRGATAAPDRTTASSGPVPASPSTMAQPVAVPSAKGGDPSPPPSASVPAAAAAATGAAVANARPADGIEVMPDFSARANDLMANHMPRLAQRAERLVARVLYVAGRADDVVGDAAILDSAGALASPAVDPVWGLALAPREAQQLNDAARSEYGRRGASAQALALQVRAFGADPLDPEVAGNLAFLLLRQRPSQPEAARRLALHALTLHGSRFPQGRVEDWATLAIASALAGRERDASNAFLVSLALAPDLERHCRAALDAFAIYGERLRVPVETMLAGVAASPRAARAPSCQGSS